MAADREAVLRYRAGLRRVLDLVRSRSDLFPAEPAPNRLLRREQREQIWGLWRSWLDYQLALDSIERAYSPLPGRRDPVRDESYLVGWGAFLADYRHGLDLAAIVRRDPTLAVALDEAVPEMGIPPRTWSRLADRHLSVAKGTEFAARAAMARAIEPSLRRELDAAISEDERAVWAFGKGRGEAMTGAQGLAVLRRIGQTAWLPVQSGVAEWMGATRVHRIGRSLISASQLVLLEAKLEPGDILLSRREWYLSNIGLPGFWPHAMLFVGDAGERRAFFSSPDAAEWLAGEGSASFEEWLAKREPAGAERLSGRERGKARVVLEAVSAGVVAVPLEEAALADSLVALRPNLPRREKGLAIARALHYLGRPYDFDFDFRTDSALVCSELVAKAYEPAAGIRGLALPTTEVLGRPVVPPNDLVRLFDLQAGRPDRLFDFVAFLDGQEAEGRAIWGDAAAARESWRRPKWHVLVQEPVTGGK
jgi:hypothetical protein